MMNMFLKIAKSYLKHFLGLPTLCWYGIFFSFLESALGGICFFLSLYFVNVLHLNIAIAGLIISFYGVGRSLGGVIAGKLSDAMSTRLIALFTLLLQAVAFLSLIWVKHICGIIFDLFFLGIGTYGFITVINLWVLERCDQSETQKLKSINLLYTASNLGLGVSALITGLLAPTSFTLIFLLSGGLFLLSTIFFLNKKLDTKTRDSVSSNEVFTSPKTSRAHSQLIWVVLSCLFLISLVVSQRNTTYLVYIHQSFKHLGYTGTSLLFALNPLLIVLFQTPLVNSLGNYNKTLMVGLGVLLMGFGMFLLIDPNSFLIAILSCVIYTFGEMIFFAMAQLVVYQGSPTKKKGQVFGLYKTTYAVSTVLGPTLGGFIYHHFGGQMLWYLSGFIGAICFFVCFMYRHVD